MVEIAEKRLKIAYFSPLPPQPSGIADYSAEFLPELSRWHEIHCIVRHPDQCRAHSGEALKLLTGHPERLCRELRWPGSDLKRKNPELQEITKAMDPNNKNTGYRLGRLFAALEGLQAAAQGSLNSTITRRFYSAASTRPAPYLSTDTTTRPPETREAMKVTVNRM